VGIKGITYAGSHGLEIYHPDESKFVVPMPSECEAKVPQLLKTLQEKVCKNGAWVENKGSLLTFHFRETPTHLRAELAEEAKQIILDHGKWLCRLFLRVREAFSPRRRPHSGPIEL